MITNYSALQTGVPGGDIVLGGGLARDALVFLVGRPGAGKTVLGCQILFNAARNGTPALILTGVSEGHAKLLDHLSSFSFFDQNMIGGLITLLSLPSLISAEQETVVGTLVRVIRQSGAKLVLIDGFQGIHHILADERAISHLLSSLANQLTYLGVTLLITLEGAARDPMTVTELTTADVVIGLNYTVDGWRHIRRMEVVKQRGRRPLSGLHTYIIDEHGVGIHPRLESLQRLRQSPTPRVDERHQFGIVELDRLLGGGLTAGTTTLLTGAAGVGKTILALHWAVAGARPDAPTVFFSFHERLEEMMVNASAFQLDLDTLRAEGSLEFIWMSPVELEPDIVATRLLEAITGAKARRLVIDDLGVLLIELGARAHSYMTALTEHLQAAGVTSLLLQETFGGSGFVTNFANVPHSLVGDSVLLLRQQPDGNTLRRLLSIVKMRFSEHDSTVHELVFDPQGLRLLPSAIFPALPIVEQL